MKGLLTDRRFIYGVVAGVLVVYAYHHFAGLPTLPGGPASARKGKAGPKKR